MRFKELQPFVNVSAVLRKQVYAEKFRHHVMWQGRNRSVIFMMLGSIQSCNIVEPTSIGQYVCRAITIIPYGDAWRSFQIFLGQLYGEGQMRGPFEYGCLLTLSSRREGYSSTAGLCSCFHAAALSYLTLLLPRRCDKHVDPRYTQEEQEGIWGYWCGCHRGMVRLETSKLHRL